MEPVNTSEPFVAPVGQPVNENLAVALGLLPTVEKKEPKLTPVAVGTGVGSVVPEVVVTWAKLYKPEKDWPLICLNLTAKNKMKQHFTKN